MEDLLNSLKIFFCALNDHGLIVKWVLHSTLVAVASFFILWGWVWLWNKKWCSDNKGWMATLVVLFFGMWFCVGITRDAAKSLRESSELMRKDFDGVSIYWMRLNGIFEQVEQNHNREQIDEKLLFNAICKHIFNYQYENPLALFFPIKHTDFNLPVKADLRLNDMYRNRGMKIAEEILREKRPDIQKYAAAAIAERQREDNKKIFTEYSDALPLDRLLCIFIPLCLLLIPISVKDIRVISACEKSLDC